MTLSLFDQFEAPTRFGVTLFALAVVLPLLLYPAPSRRWLSNRLLSTQKWAIHAYIKQLLIPIATTTHRWAALLGALMIFIITLNVMGLLPYTFTPTAQLSFNMALAFPIWLATVIIGFRNQPTPSLAHFLPEGTPPPLIPVLIIIETISLFIRPIALAVRLTANLTAGHLLIHLLSLATYLLIFIMPLASLLAYVVLFLLTLLEMAVAMIQAYVFVLLISLYLQENS
uniref:ATP synthase subunit a n=1 Tax=Champsodon cf. snyderi CBM-ZF 10876 TaxID=270612 RepID=T2HVQ6_9TELE|nr:ATP synthase F0 subunit 6 [Champsodon cf. snyderi CBM-ZF 10876]BAN83383.1 ATPase subunit 6 [Champsodon cf. snyderi CBM-ZF 10876]